MTWKEKTVARILLIIAKMLCEDSEIKAEIHHLHSHIAVNAPQKLDFDLAVAGRDPGIAE